jgi:AbrB family looped-hinge helix DNA binding protein
MYFSEPGSAVREVAHLGHRAILEADMPKPFTCAELQIGPQGRIVIPAAVRQMLGLESGDKLVVRVENDCLVLEKADAIRKRLRKRFEKVAGDSLAAELLRERRTEVEGERAG